MRVNSLAVWDDANPTADCDLWSGNDVVAGASVEKAQCTKLSPTYFHQGAPMLARHTPVCTLEQLLSVS